MKPHGPWHIVEPDDGDVGRTTQAGFRYRADHAKGHKVVRTEDRRGAAFSRSVTLRPASHASPTVDLLSKTRLGEHFSDAFANALR